MASEERMIALKLEANKVGQFVHTIELPPKEYAFQRMAYSIGNGCQWIGIHDCHESLPLEKYCLVFDEEFLFCDKSYMNPIASYMHGLQEGFDPLCGNVLILKNGYDKNGEINIVGLNEEDIKYLINYIKDNMHKVFCVEDRFWEQVSKMN